MTKRPEPAVVRRTSGWAERADYVLSEVFRALPRDATEADVKRACRDAYPFGPREHWPYKAWLQRVAAWKQGREAGLHGPIGTAARRRTKAERTDTETGELFG